MWHARIGSAEFVIMKLAHFFIFLSAVNVFHFVKPEIDFSVPDLDPRNPFYKGRPANVFGKHAEPTPYVEEIQASPEDQFPTPVEFHERYIKEYKPVVLRGAAMHSAAYHLWTEEYLKEMYGGLSVRLEARSEDNSRIPSGVGGMGRDTISNFLDRYQTLDGYIISQIPTPMEKDIAFPPFLTCGSLAQGVQEVHLFLSSRGGKTLLHRDPYSSIHCVFNGTKQWLIADPIQKERLYMSEDSRFEFGGYSGVNVDDVDYDIHRNVKDLVFDRVILEKGDCIYMPSGYTHQVRSRGYMNSAVSIWFSHYLTFDPTGCEESGNTFQPMSESSVLWRYSGQGELSQGHMDVHMLRIVMKTIADTTGKIWLGEFTDNFIQGELNDEELLVKQRLEFMEILDTNGKGYITVEELDSLPLQTLKNLVEVIDPSDASNKGDFEYHHIDKDAIWGALTMLRGHNPSQPFSGSDFIKIYTFYLGGSKEVAKEILAVLDPEGTNQIDSRMIMQYGDKAFEKFGKGYRHDPTIEKLWYKQFVAKGIFQEFGVNHFDNPEERWITAESDVGGECDSVEDVGHNEIVYVNDPESIHVCDKKSRLEKEEGRKEELNQVEEKEMEQKVQDSGDDRHDEL
ncbi:uncharacterized protein LOC121424814 [Lytechinus variegatus]|uniref:uncharacterized protein LOC121424814 n=1 Tax=Lytechinus variegatus TaxID=7654 RepID=UPI001BB202AF|nr:uncharacterized protein LOC121424814 [Lytechinus variegatus]